MPALRPIKIDIVSDTICPWCYIGKRRLETAIDLMKEEYEGLTFNIKWWPYELDPTLPREGVDKKQRYREKFGADRVEKMIPYMVEVAKREGIDMNYEGKVGNTLDSHRLVALAGKQGKEGQMVETLFKSYFTESKNISDAAVLAEAANAVGVTGAEEMLRNGGGEEEVRQEINTWRKKWGITGVPFFIIDDRVTISGAQEPDTFVNIFQKIVERQSAH